MGIVYPPCPYCGETSELVTGAQIYDARKDFSDLYFYACIPCGAWVGTHERTLEPLGTLADQSLRMMRISAHKAFDPLWKRQRWRRGKAYKWLSQRLGLPIDQCHIGMMGEAECRRVVEVCQEMKEFANGTAN